MKLVVSGSAGVGKSSLAKLLADQYSLQYLPENYAPIFADGNREAPPPRQAGNFQTVLDIKNNLELEHQNSITDRSPLDLFHLWMGRNLYGNARQTQKLFQQCTQQMSAYDYVILLPWGSIPLIQPQEGEQKRLPSPWGQLKNHASIVGLINMCVPAKKIITVPGQINDLQKRLQWITKVIEQRNNN